MEPMEVGALIALSLLLELQFGCMQQEKLQRLIQLVRMDHVALLLVHLDHVELVEQSLEQQLAQEQEVELELELTIDTQEQGPHHQNGHSYLEPNIQQHIPIPHGLTQQHGVEAVAKVVVVEVDGYILLKHIHTVILSKLEATGMTDKISLQTLLMVTQVDGCLLRE